MAKRKTKAIRVAEAFIDLMPPCEWERMNFPNCKLDPSDIRDLIMLAAETSLCYRTMDKALERAQDCLNLAVRLTPASARCWILRFVNLYLFNHWW